MRHVAFNTRFLRSLLVCMALLAMAGCESIQEIDRAAGEWAKAHEAQRAAAEEARRQRGVLTEARQGCRQITQSLRLPWIDPDSAYVRIKHYFGFHTPDEAQKAYPNPEWLPYTHYRHETQPGVRYSLSEEVVWPSAVYGRRSVWLTLDIEREKRGSLIRWSWCQGADGWKNLGAVPDIQRQLAQDIQRAAGGSR
jgi:hypothetical protein